MDQTHPFLVTRSARRAGTGGMRGDWRSFGGVLLLAIIWGSSFALVEVALTRFSPLAVVVSRIWLAGLVLSGVLVILRLPIPRGRRVWRQLALLGLLSLVLPFTALAWGQTLVSSNVAAVFISGSPLFVLLLARLVLREPVAQRRWIGFILGFAGLLVLIGPQALLSLTTAPPLGQLACLSAALSFALSTLVVRKLPADMHPVSATTGAMIAAMAMCIPLALIAAPIPPLSGAPLLALVVLGLVQTGAAHVLRFYTVRRAGPVFVSSVGYLIPLWAGLLSVVVLGEVFAWQTMVAYAFVIAGLLIAEPRPDRPKDA